MKVVILISCMHQKDASIIERSNVQCDVIVVNQCDCDCIEKFSFTNKFGKECHATFICTTERGLSKSRNMAISYADDDSICLICDDDEVFEDNVEDIITNAYAENPDASLIAFALIRKDLANGKKYPTKKTNLGFIQILKTSSVQLTFRKYAAISSNICFDEKMGSGTGNGGGEENKFLLDFRRAGLKLYYIPQIIATILPGESKWFHEYDEKYLTNLGWATRRAMGDITGFIYCCYWAITHHHMYKSDGVSLYKALKRLYIGYLSNR